MAKACSAAQEKFNKEMENQKKDERDAHFCPAPSCKTKTKAKTSKKKERKHEGKKEKSSSGPGTDAVVSIKSTKSTSNV